MNSENLAASPADPGLGMRRFFTLESANRALVLVRKVVTDVVEQYRNLAQLRAEREELVLATNANERLEQVQDRIESAVTRLNALHDELIEIGCELKDWSVGLVDFPSMHDGRQIWLCWKLGENEVLFWHEWNAGYAGRREVDDAFRELEARTRA